MHYNRIAREAKTSFAALVTASAAAALLCTSAQAQAKRAAATPPSAPRRTFAKPADAELKKKLTPLQYAVTQHAQNAATAAHDAVGEVGARMGRMRRN